MSNATRLHFVKVGINANTNTYGTEPGAYVPILPVGEAASLLPRGREPIAVDDRITSDGREQPHLHGAKNTDDITIPLELTGINDNSGGAVSDWEAKNEGLGLMLASIFGDVADVTTGAKPTVAASGHSSTTLVEDGTTVLADLDIILFQTSTGRHARQVVSGGGTGTVALDRAYTGTPVSGSDIIRAARYTWVPGRTRHKAIWVDAEDTAQASGPRRRYQDCAPKQLQLAVPSSGKVTATATFAPNDWDKPAAANPSFDQPVIGSPIVGGDAALYIGAVEKLFKSLSLTAVVGYAPRESPAGANGFVGGEAADRKSVVLELTLYLGDDNGSIGDVVDGGSTPALADFTGDAANLGAEATTRDIALQLGTRAGAAGYLRFPAAAITGRVEVDGPYKVLRTTFRATGATPFYMGLF